MEEKQKRPVTTEQEAPGQIAPRQPWQRPTLERLHVSLDTTFGLGSASDSWNLTVK